MPRFMKRPVIVEATRWFSNGDHPEDAIEKVSPKEGEPFDSEGKVVRYYRDPDKEGVSLCEICGRTIHDHGWIDTLEGGHIVCAGDWIITGVKGERYPCKDDIFRETYEASDEAGQKAWDAEGA